jgi:class 3 adenylate cyclase
MPCHAPKMVKYLTGKRLLTTQVFRDLFRAESVPGEAGIALKNLSLLFTDLKGSTEMYERIGDLRAFDLVSRHFDLLRDLVRSRGGAVVKTIGDAVMASFSEPAGALDAAAAMTRDIRSIGDLELKIGIHAGPCIAVQSNEQLDYFGQTVNIAARVQGIARAGEIVCTSEVMEAAGSAEVVRAASLKAVAGSAMLKGVEGAVAVHRLR